MLKVYLLSLVVFLSACSSPQIAPKTEATTTPRKPSGGLDLTGTYLGEGLFSKKRKIFRGLRRPAMRIYLERAPEGGDVYYAALVEYAKLQNMGLPYFASQKAPALNKVVGYLDKIATRISAYKLVPGSKPGSYEMYNLLVQNGQIVPASEVAMTLMLPEKADSSSPLAGAEILGNKDGKIVFPVEPGKLENVGDALGVSQYELAKFAYKKAHLASTWRGNWSDLEGSYLSEYGRFTDGVLELYSQDSQKKAKFIKTNRTKAKYFTNPKSAAIEGDFVATEPIPKMYVLVSTNSTATASDKEMTGRIGLFLDVFDGSAPEAGSHLVTELAFTNPADPKDFMMYYEHPEHVKNIGVEPKK